MVGIAQLEVEADASPEAETYQDAHGRTLRVRAYRRLKTAHWVCEYTLDGYDISRGDAISFLATGKTLFEREQEMGYAERLSYHGLHPDQELARRG